MDEWGLGCSMKFQFPYGMSRMAWKAVKEKKPIPKYHVRGKYPVKKKRKKKFAKNQYELEILRLSTKYDDLLVAVAKTINQYRDHVTTLEERIRKLEEKHGGV